MMPDKKNWYHNISISNLRRMYLIWQPNCVCYAITEDIFERQQLFLFYISRSYCA